MEPGLTISQIKLFSQGNDTAHKILVSNILITQRMETLWAANKPQIVFHCATYKHVPLMEEAPCEAVLVNLKGTQILSELSRKYAVERFVFISTDKASEPTGVMGTTKHFAESLVLSTPSDQTSFFTAVRFGNVLNSRGSVALFTKADRSRWICNGYGSVTDKDMTRLLMDLSEAESLIIQSAAYIQGGDVFMLNMAQPIKISDLTSKLTRLNGLRTCVYGEDIAIVFYGNKAR
jgi:FlaA1/EpsC-like NDP-sugar epimerase